MRMQQLAIRALACLFVFATPVAATDYWVDAGRGSDDKGKGTRTEPWQSIAFALSKIPTPTYPQSHRLRIVGDQTYTVPAPIVVKYNVALEGVLGPKGERPRLIAKSAAVMTLLRFDPRVTYNRREASVKNLDFIGAVYGIWLGGLGKRHRPEIASCRFEKQWGAGLRIDVGPSTTCDPRLFRLEFVDQSYGIEAYTRSSGALLRADVDECRFARLEDAALRITSEAGRADFGASMQRSVVEDCGAGVQLVAQRGGVGARAAVRSCRFVRCRGDAVSLRIGLAGSASLDVAESSFVDCAAGVRFGGMIAAGVQSVTVRDCLALRCGVGFGYEGERVLGSPELKITSERNSAIACGTGFVVELGADSAYEVLGTMRGDRALRGRGVGFLAKGAGSKARLDLESIVAAGNTGHGVEMRGALAGRLSFATLADNGGAGLAVRDARSQLAVDHCIFDRNKVVEALVPTGFVIRWSSFDRKAWPGHGNRRQDAKLLRPLYVLAADSPCIDAGDPSEKSVVQDFEGDPRPIGKAHDLGADEVAIGGGARLFGVGGFGSPRFVPRFELARTQPKIGATLRLELADALDYSKNAASVAFVFVGAREGIGVPLDLAALGAPGSFLLVDLDGMAFGAKVSSEGKASVAMPLPKLNALVGVTLIAQWLVIKRGVNAGGFVTTRGLRLRIGR